MLFSFSRRGLLVALTGALCWPLAWSQVATVAPVFPFAAPSAAMPLPPELAARAFVLQDLSSQQTLAARNADQPVEPASLTKLMTAYLAFQAMKSGKLTLLQEVPVSERAWRTGITGTSRSFLAANSRVKVEDLLKGMIVQSGNDASVALAEAVGGTVENFVAMMNRQALAFGLKATTFKNPEGQTAPGHRSTARELSVIAVRLATDFPQALPYYGSKEFTFGGVRQPNRNLLLWRDPTVDGLKTSYTDASGYCLIATALRATPAGPRRLLSVVIGATSPETRANESQKLLNWGYGSFDMVKLFDANKPVTTAPVWKGQSSSVRLGRVSPVTVVVPRGQAGGLKATVARNDPLVAPLIQGQTVGTLKITLAGQPWQDVPLNTLEAVPSAGWFGRLWDAIRLGVK
ncbi:MAG: D-alanyl-D-alanine carboxypeptidase family protein [Aquabacterium sp.]|uniref:D-alanyl-D-alanine carboxypeptidase family protein n=1 Tax=Aquabacterium sp. TaxID=1872578 RepID=UPI00271ED44D|nr:D-alanyl-D-alanine carboxypeptidase family protein [Aquabacterium sp.]MDO9005154.1 D-alanyl-D-alanine carboxypeptidase family protein [Aquabacterium sp.]